MKPLLHRLFLGFCILCPLLVAQAEKPEVPSIADQSPARITTVSIQGDDIHINGRPTYEGRTWNGHRIEGLLFNNRLVNATFDDLNPETVTRWAYPDTKQWDPERNVSEFIAAMPEMKDHGVLGLTLNFQGGSPEGYSKGQPWENHPFNSDGTLRPAFADRMKRVLDEADRLGMVPIVGYFYFGQSGRLKTDENCIRATDTLTKWLLDGGWKNVLVEINNESSPGYRPEILRPDRVHELIARVRDTKSADGRRLLVGTSFPVKVMPTAEVVRASDFILLHGNGFPDARTLLDKATATRALAPEHKIPVLINEDDHNDFADPNGRLQACTAAHISWGWFDWRRKDEPFEEGYQSMPANWGLSSKRKREFHSKVAEITGSKPATASINKVAPNLPPASSAEPIKPNIIVIVTDDQGYADLGCQGVVKDVKTPHLDALAAAGVRCTAGYITAPQCSPSRAGLITGRYQARFGVEDIASCPLPLEEVTMAEHLRTAGYRNGFVGKWHLDVNVLCEDWLKKNVPDLKRARRGYQVPPGVAEKFSPQAQGFDDFYAGELKRYHANYTLDGKAEPQPRHVSDDRFRVDVQSDAAVAFIAKNKAAPFYLHLCYYAPHVPLEATAKYLDRFPGDMPTRRRYALAMLSALDDGVGRIVARLKEDGLQENTLIIFTSDNGAPLKGKKDAPIDKPGGAWDGSLNDPLNGEKGQLLEGGIRVPYLVSWPARLPAGKTYDRPVSSLDIAATALAAAGLPHDPKLDGVNILPHLSGEVKTDAHSALYWRFWGQTAVRSGDWKLIRQPGNKELLFHLSDDISEKTDLLSMQPDKASELRGLLTKWESQMVPPKPRAVRKEEAF